MSRGLTLVLPTTTLTLSISQQPLKSTPLFCCRHLASAKCTPQQQPWGISQNGKSFKSCPALTASSACIGRSKFFCLSVRDFHSLATCLPFSSTLSPHPINSPTTCPSSPLPGPATAATKTCLFYPVPAGKALSGPGTFHSPVLGPNYLGQAAVVSAPEGQEHLLPESPAHCQGRCRSGPHCAGIPHSGRLTLDPKLLKGFSVAPTPFSYSTQGLPPPSPHHTELLFRPVSPRRVAAIREGGVQAGEACGEDAAELPQYPEEESQTQSEPWRHSRASRETSACPTTRSAGSVGRALVWPLGLPSTLGGEV